MGGEDVDEDVLHDALRSLALPGVSVRDAAAEVPNTRGLYAIRGGPTAWAELGLGEPHDDRPLYVGKAEDSLVTRDLKSHFGTGKTGRSTVRRSIGSLLADQLDLVAQPRNPDKPGSFASFAFEPAGDERLTEWMLDHLRLATWTPTDEVRLDPLETRVLQHLGPPLNLDKVNTAWKTMVSDARRRQAGAARTWRPRAEA